MGGQKYRSHKHFEKFLKYSSDAFKTLRQSANILEALFALMVAAGMPELMKETDIYYMRDKLLLNVEEKKAVKRLNEEIENSLESKYRRFDNFIHNMRHG
jgi:3-deoxy-D-arabino-heptulosonate 7-phosphate (DAHP) synthase class II